MLPSVDIKKQDGSTGVVKPSAEGVLAIIAPSEKGTKNLASSHARPDLALAEFGHGPLVEFAAYDMSVAQKPVLLIRPDASTEGAYGSITITGGGSATVTAGATKPLDDFDVLVRFPTGGTIGTAGITYTYSLDGGKSVSALVALGTANQIVLPNTGITFALGAGTILADESFTCRTTGPRITNADLVTALEALRVTASSWDTLLVAADADATMVATLDLWLSAREGEGKYRTAVVNARPRNATETEAQYKTAMQAAWASAASIRVVVCADAGDLVSLLRGIRQARPVSLGLAARGMASDISTDAAFVADGPIPGFVITDDRGNPKYHDEALFPGLDDLRLASLRSINGREGAYVTNPNLISPSGSDFVYWQHARVMNKGCEITFAILTGRLSQGVITDPKPGPNGEIFILEAEAQEIEGLVNAELDKQLVKPRRVSGAKFILSRTDDLGSNAPATLTGDLQISALRYVKTFKVNARFVRRITATAA